jgi:hypothetical protein
LWWDVRLGEVKAGNGHEYELGVVKDATGDDFEALGTPIKPHATAMKEVGKYRKGE